MIKLKGTWAMGTLSSNNTGLIILQKRDAKNAKQQEKKSVYQECVHDLYIATENPPFSSMIFPLTPPFLSEFPLPHLMTAEGIASVKA